MRIPVLGVALTITLAVLCHTEWHTQALAIANFAVNIFIGGHVVA
jgi:hypothetical protein